MNPAHLHNPKFTKHRFPRETTGATRRHLMTPLRLRLEIELPLKSPDRMRCRQTHRQSPLLGFLGSVPEVRVLPSPGVTRLPRYYDPLRLPAGPPACLAWGPLPPRRRRASHVARDTFPTCRPQYPGEPGRCWCRFLPGSCSLPRHEGGSAFTTSLSRPAQGSLALRPAGSLDRPRRPWSRGFNRLSYPSPLLVSYRTYRQLSGWNLPPLASRAFVAHFLLYG